MTGSLILASAILLPHASNAAVAGQSNPARLCEGYGGVPERSEQPYAGIIWIPGGTFTMGDDDEQSEERAAHQVTVAGFWIDRHEVTNAQFAIFVEATGYRTVAERGLDPKQRPDLPPELLVPGSTVFHQPDSQRGWTAGWRHSGDAPGFTSGLLAGLADHDLIRRTLYQ